jgi:formylglycine-generating enzyme required for sulfatase activity
MNRTSLPILAVPLVLSSACGGEEDGDNGGSGGGDVQPAKMVQLPAGFSIDSTEVTRAQYAAWLATKPSAQPPECSWNTSFTPGCDWPPGDKGDHPVVCVDWCDAHAYCQGVGKRLCGKIGGGALAIAERADATKSEWYYACSSGGEFDYPYGDDYDPTACNLEDAKVEDTSPGGAFPKCQSSAAGFEGVYDLGGNVYEWVDSCAGSGADDGCVRHGATYASPGSSSKCGPSSTNSRSERWGGLGFRCCRD